MIANVILEAMRYRMNTKKTFGVERQTAKGRILEGDKLFVPMILSL